MKPMTGMFLSTGKPTSAWRASFRSNFASINGFHSWTSIPFTIPLMPALRMILSNSTPLSEPVTSSWA
ncbi:Wx1 [Quillaja saponaria]|uniref:Wx1 n=1 Tax=Quillaja saponaria TaxID=32244 RepID=A0AAD7LU31_QUISA|nr:Wx1 [Quillaja saponaria]